MKTKFRKAALAAAVAGTFAGASTGVQAAAFGLIEQSGSGMGNAYAGAAATAEDASTVFFNPAGMSRLDGSQAAIAAHVINVSAKFSGTGSLPANMSAATLGGTGGNAGGTAVVPNLYAVMPFGDRMHFGLGVNVPFGLTTEYDDDWLGRFQGIKSELMSLNVNPSISYKLSDAVSIGGGINYQKTDVTLTSAVVLGLNTEGRTKLEAEDDGWGWNVGVLFQAGPATRVGLSYRSAIEYDLEGDVTTTFGGAVVGGASGPAKAEVTFPDTFSASMVHAVNDRLELLGDVSFTRWSELDEVRVVNTTNGTLREVFVFDFDDSWRVSVGANYKYSDTWTLKAGVAYDQTPVKNASTRTVRLPDQDRTWLALGAQRKVGANGRLDLGYAHLFIKDADINHTRSQQSPGNFTPTPQPATASTVTGTYKGSVDIISLQYTHSF